MHESLATAKVDLAAVAVRVVRLEQLIAKRHQIRMTRAPGAIDGFWDAELLERMLASLLANAVKYSPRGSSVEVHLERQVDDKGRWAVMDVADEGIGIPSGDVPFVFEPYYRGRNVGTVPGSGLGLASVWQLVEKCAGQLHVESREGIGTTVTVRLPAA
jgi:signal transduction histidine kinase